jgi:hypothetical protein
VAGVATIACGCAVPPRETPSGVHHFVEAHRELVGGGSFSRWTGLTAAHDGCEAPAVGLPRFHATAESSRLAPAASAE